MQKCDLDDYLGRHLPIPTQVVSNEEFYPLPQTAEQKAVEHHLLEMGERMAKKAGMDRRRFLRTARATPCCGRTGRLALEPRIKTRFDEPPFSVGDSEGTVYTHLHFRSEFGGRRERAVFFTDSAGTAYIAGETPSSWKVGALEIPQGELVICEFDWRQFERDLEEASYSAKAYNERKRILDRLRKKHAAANFALYNFVGYKLNTVTALAEEAPSLSELFRKDGR